MWGYPERLHGVLCSRRGCQMPGVVQTDPSWGEEHLSPGRWYLPWVLTSEACPQQCLPRGTPPLLTPLLRRLPCGGAMGPAGPESAMVTVSSSQLPGQSPALEEPQRWLRWGCVWQAWGTHPRTGTPRVSRGRGRPGLTRTEELSVDHGRKHTWRGTPAPQLRKSPSQWLPAPHLCMLRRPKGRLGPSLPPRRPQSSVLP